MKRIAEFFISGDCTLQFVPGFKVVFATFDFMTWTMALTIEEDNNSSLRESWQFARKYYHQPFEDHWDHVASFQEDYNSIHYYMRRVG